jgi:hypothetical protein
MKETQWNACNDPEEMFEMLGTAHSAFRRPRRGTPTLGEPIFSRKMRLFSCACCREIWEHLPDERSRRAVELSEQYADKKVGRDELMEAWLKAIAAATDEIQGEERSLLRTLLGLLRLPSSALLAPVWAAWEPQVASERVRARFEDPAQAIPNLSMVTRFQVAYYLHRSANSTPLAAAQAAASAAEPLFRDEEKLEKQCVIMRDVLGYPLRRLPPPDPCPLAWNDRAVVKIATTIYNERAFTDMPILADALEDAGCREPEMIAHCREHPVHVRGCWVLDRLLAGIDKVTG